MFDLNGRIAIMTGSSQGIGRKIAEIFAEFNADVIVNYPGDTEQAAAESSSTRYSPAGREPWLFELT